MGLVRVLHYLFLTHPSFSPQAAQHRGHIPGPLLNSIRENTILFFLYCSKFSIELAPKCFRLYSSQKIVWAPVQQQMRAPSHSTSRMTIGTRQLTLALICALETVFRVQLLQDAPLLEKVKPNLL